MRRVLACGLLLLGLGACAHPGKDLPVGSYERGVAELEGEHYLDAIEDLKLFLRRNPTDELADDAQFAVAQAYQRSGDHAVAAVEYEILRKDFPTSELAEEAFYQEGMCYVEQVPPIELEQSATRRALAHFQRYLAEYPDGERHGDAQEQIDQLSRHLDRKELEAARLYARLGNWRAVEVTLAASLAAGTGSELRPDMLLLRGRALRKLDREEEARAVFRELVEQHPGHPLAARATSLLAGEEEPADAGEG